MIWIDSREPASVQRAVQRVAQETGIQTLDTGDFLMFDQDGHTLAVERKTVNDLIASLGDGRLRTQLARLGEFSHPILLVEGTLRLNSEMRVAGRGKKGWTHGAVQMILLHHQQHNRIDVLWTPSLEGTADILRVLEQRAAKGCFSGKPRRTGERVGADDPG